MRNDEARRGELDKTPDMLIKQDPTQSVISPTYIDRLDYIVSNQKYQSNLGAG